MIVFVHGWTRTPEGSPMQAKDIFYQWKFRCNVLAPDFSEVVRKCDSTVDLNCFRREGLLILAE